MRYFILFLAVAFLAVGCRSLDQGGNTDLSESVDSLIEQSKERLALEKEVLRKTEKNEKLSVQLRDNLEEATPDILKRWDEVVRATSDTVSVCQRSNNDLIDSLEAINNRGSSRNFKALKNSADVSNRVTERLKNAQDKFQAFREALQELEKALRTCVDSTDEAGIENP